MGKLKFNGLSKDKLKLRSLAYKIYNERIKECEDGQNHKNPSKDDNRCLYCYNRIEYKTTEVQEILKSRKNLPSNHQPMDAPVLREIDAREVAFMKFQDYFYALGKIEEEIRRDETGLAKKL